MNDAAKQAERTLAVLSPAYMESEFAEAEWAAAFADDPTGKTGKLVPVRIEEFDPSGLLKALGYVDLVELEEDQATAALLAAMEQRRAKPPSQPVFPGAERTVAKVVAAVPRFPGMLPGVWRMPHLRNPRFVGRATTLGWMSEELSAGGRVALFGLGGVGKTQIAVEYVYSTTDLDVVWWLRAEDPVTMVEDLAGLGDALGVPVADSPAETAARVLEALRTRTGWLLVFDNATEPETIHEWLPAGKSGRVVITTRNPGFHGVASTNQVKPMDHDDATRFITDRIGSAATEQVEGLAEDLGRLPLAMEQATAYIAATGRTIENYRGLLKTSQAGELLARGAAAADYPDTVATTWDLAFKKVANTKPAATELLNVAAFLAPDGIPRALFATSGEDDALPEQLIEAIADPLGFDDLVVTLGRYSLIDVEADTLSVHRLVQGVTRDRLDEHGPYVDASLQLVANAFFFDADDPASWTLAVLITHVVDGVKG